MDQGNFHNFNLDNLSKTLSPGAVKDIAILMEKGWVIVDGQKIDVDLQKGIESLPTTIIMRHKAGDGPMHRTSGPNLPYWRNTDYDQSDPSEKRYIINGITLINRKFIEKVRRMHPHIYEWPKESELLLKEYQFSLHEEKSDFNYLTEATKVQAIIKEVYQDHSKLFKMEPFEFEKMVAELLRTRDFEVELTKRTRDGGYDMLAIQSLAGIPLRFLVECKRYAANRPIDVGIVRSFSHVINKDGANKGLLFTTSYFTRDAIKLRDTDMPYLLDFQDNAGIINWVSQYVKK